MVQNFHISTLASTERETEVLGLLFVFGVHGAPRCWFVKPNVGANRPDAACGLARTADDDRDGWTGQAASRGGSG